MTHQHREFSELLKKHLQLEKKTSDLLQRSQQKLTNLPAKLMIESIRQDTIKHIKIIKAVLHKVNEEKKPTSSKLHKWTDMKVAMEELKKHIELEELMLKHVKKEKNKTQDSVIQYLLEHIIEDEKRHHKIFKNIIKGYQKERDIIIFPRKQ
jgi:hypothetical protein